MNDFSFLQKFAIWFLPILFAITLHEAAHAWVAKVRGDQTAARAGRVTLNPIKHIDLMGTLIIPTVMLMLSGFIFGWAKPVPVNTQQLRNPRWDSALVALAGPMANLLMAIFWAPICRIGFEWMMSLQAAEQSIAPALWLYLMGKAGIMINLFLMILNLLPIPPLDGSRIVASTLPPKPRFHYLRAERFGFLILLALLVTGVLAPIIAPAFSLFQFMITGLFGLPA